MAKKISRLSEAWGINVYKATDQPKDGLALQPFDGEAEGAIPNGTRIEKCNREKGDSLPNGSQGVVVASMDFTEHDPKLGIAYVIHWDKWPKIPVLIAGKRVRALDAAEA